MFYRFFMWLDSLWTSPPTTALTDAILGLEDAKKQSLTEKSMADYAASEVICHKARAEYHDKRIVRLKAFIHDEEEDQMTEAKYQGSSLPIEEMLKNM